MVKLGLEQSDRHTDVDKAWGRRIILPVLRYSEQSAKKCRTVRLRAGSLGDGIACRRYHVWCGPLSLMLLNRPPTNEATGFPRVDDLLLFTHLFPCVSFHSYYRLDNIR